MKDILKRLIVAVALIGAPAAYAIPTLTISDGLSTVTVVDNSAGDIDPTEGRIDWYSYVAFDGWFYSHCVGATKPYLGSAADPAMDLAFFGQSLRDADLTITFTDSGFTYLGGIVDAWSGTAQDQVSNQILLNGEEILAQGPLGPGAFLGSALGQVELGENDLLSLVVTIHHTRDGITDLSKLMTTTPPTPPALPDGGSTLALWGIVITGFGLIRRRI